MDYERIHRVIYREKLTSPRKKITTRLFGPRRLLPISTNLEETPAVTAPEDSSNKYTPESRKYGLLKALIIGSPLVAAMGVVSYNSLFWYKPTGITYCDTKGNPSGQGNEMLLTRKLGGYEQITNTGKNCTVTVTLTKDYQTILAASEVAPLPPAKPAPVQPVAKQDTNINTELPPESDPWKFSRDTLAKYLGHKPSDTQIMEFDIIITSQSGINVPEWEINQDSPAWANDLPAGFRMNVNDLAREYLQAQ